MRKFVVLLCFAASLLPHYLVHAHCYNSKYTLLRGGSSHLQLSSSTSYDNFSRSFSTTGSENYEKDSSDNSNITMASSSVQNKQRSIVGHESIALALRLTCELNRRFRLGAYMSMDTPLVENYDQASIFYTPPSRRTDLNTFIMNIHRALGFENDPFVASVILMYLDRACSVETYRSEIYPDDRSVACPFLTVASVHKLYLSASILALRAVRNELPPVLSRGAFHDDVTNHYFKKIQDVGDRSVMDITTYELGSLLEWMFASLGFEGLVVKLDEVHSFIEKWKDLFELEDGAV